MYGRRLLIPAMLCIALAACGDDERAGGGTPTTGYERDCRVQFGITSAGSFGTLEFQVDYSRTGGEFVGLGRDVECRRLDERITVWTSNWNCTPRESCYSGKMETLYISAFAGRDFPTPVDLVECRFASDVDPSADDFRFEGIFAMGADWRPLDPLPVPAVIDIACDAPSSTTTSTTLPDLCADVTCDAGEACNDGVCVPATAYEIDVAVETVETYGALQLDVLYDCRQGAFDGDGSRVLCTANSALNALVSFNDEGCAPGSEEGHLGFAMVASYGFDGPMRLATCRYTDATGEAPLPERFGFLFEDASSPTLEPISGVRFAISAIRPVAR